MLKKQLFSKFSKVLLVFGMILSMCFNKTYDVSAWDSNIPHEFTRVKEISYPWWWSQKIDSTRSWSTVMCKYNGQLSYCLEASKNTPVAGDYAAQVIDHNTAVRKLLYYGYGGPGYNSEMKSIYDQQLKACVPDDFSTSKGNWDDGAYLFTHIWLSYAYCGDLMGLNIEGFNQKWPNPDGNGGYGDNILWGYHVILSKPDPGNGAEFSTGSNANFQAAFDKTNMIQKTNSIRFNAGNHETIQIPLQDHVTLHVEGTSISQTGGVATIYGEQTFYLTAPLDNSLSDYKSPVLNSSAKGKFCALAIMPGGDKQSHGSWVYENASNLQYSVDWLDFGYIDLYKSSSNKDLTNTNGCYSLKGAQYGIYCDGVKVDEIMTDENGYGKSSILPVGNYTVKEIKASPGYQLDQTEYHVTVNKEKTVTVEVKEVPFNAVAIEITKIDAETKNVSQGMTSLENAEFTIKYYDDYYEKHADLPNKATKTWVIQTKKNTENQYVACLLDSYKVAGDSFYYNDGIPVLPLGTLTIQETKAPKGYLLKEATLFDKNGHDVSVENGILLTQIQRKGDSASLVAGHYTVSSDKVIKGKIKVTKKSMKTEEVVSYRETSFGVYAKNDMYIGEKYYKANERITELKTKDGVAVSDDLPYGCYIIKEDDAPDGFEINLDKQEVEIKKDGQVYPVTFLNKEKTGQLTLYKTLSNHQATFTGDAFIEGNHYALYALTDIVDPATGKMVYKQDEAISRKIIGTGVYGDDGEKVTDKNGQCSWENLPLGKYYAKETKTNVSLVLNKNKVIFPELTENEVDQTEIISQSVHTSDKVKEFQFVFFKQNIESKFDKHNGLNGATFQIKLKDDVDKYGWEKASLQDEVTTKEMNGKNGYAQTKYLPYSTYIVKETDAPQGYQQLLDPFIISFDNVNEKFTFFVNGKEIGDNDDNYQLIFDENNELYTINMTIFNQHLVKTGDESHFLLYSGLTMGSLGVIVFIIVEIYRRKQDN